VGTKVQRGKIRGGRRELQRRSIISIHACKLQSVTVIGVGGHDDTYKRGLVCPLQISGELMCGSLFLLLARRAASPFSMRFFS